MSTASEPNASEDHGARLRAGRLSLFTGIAVFAGKLLAYVLTGSNAIFADAMESTVNVVAAAMLVFSLVLASKPPDRDHPYGHGRIEFLSAALEGTAISVAAVLIFVASMHDLLAGPAVRSLDVGIALTVAFTLVNLLLGRHLVAVGARTRSLALQADGRHVLTDVWTSGGVVAGLGIVWATGWVWADPLIAMSLAVNVLREGWQLLRAATAGLMDQADPETLDHLVALLARVRGDELIDAHSLRSWRSGSRRHVDLHVTVPRYFDVERIHRIHDTIEEGLFGDDPDPGSVVVHFDPCDPAHCRHCSMPSCPIRGDAFEALLPFERERLTREDAVSHRAGTIVGGRPR